MGKTFKFHCWSRASSLQRGRGVRSGCDIIGLIARQARQPFTTGTMSLLVLPRPFWASKFHDTSVCATKNRTPKGACVVPSAKCLWGVLAKNLPNRRRAATVPATSWEGKFCLYAAPVRRMTWTLSWRSEKMYEYIRSQIWKRKFGKLDSGRGKRSRVQLYQQATTEYS